MLKFKLKVKNLKSTENINNLMKIQGNFRSCRFCIYIQGWCSFAVVSFQTINESNTLKLV